MRDAHLHESTESETARTLREGFSWLRFSPALEREFLTEHRSANRRRIRLSVCLALATVSCFAILDRVLFGAYEGEVSGFVRLGLHIPLAALCIVLTAQRWYRYYWPYIQVAAPVFGLGTVYLAATQGNDIGVSLLGARLVLAIFFFYFMLGLPFLAALRTNLIVFIGYAIAAVAADISPPVAIYQLVILLCANIFAGAGCYALERANRVSFLERKLLTEVATHDALTSLANRAAFEAEIRRAWAQASREREPLAIVMLDIDHFKTYNDRYGHQAGDRCLRDVARTMRKVAQRRPTDVVARYGGEELIAVLPGCTLAHAEAVARDLLVAINALAIPHAASMTQPHVTVSVGVTSLVPEKDASHDVAVHAADRALYLAKAEGRNRHATFDPHERRDLTLPMFAAG